MMGTDRQFKVFRLTELTPHPRNKMIYGEKEDDGTFAELVNLIKEHGLRTKIVVNENGVIISGHRRYNALKELGYKETECEVRHYENEMEELRDLVICNSGRRQKTRVQQLREGEAIYEVEEWKANQRRISTQNNNRAVMEQSSMSDNDEKGTTRDIVAKIISWGSGTKSSGKDYSLGRSALKESDRLREEGNTDLADIIITQINKRGAHAAYDLAFKVDIGNLNDATKAGLRSGQISGRSNSLPLKPEFAKSPKEKGGTEKEETEKPTNITAREESEKQNKVVVGNEYTGTTTESLEEETVREYIAQSRGEIKIVIPEKERGYVSKTYEAAMTEFRRKTAQCMTHQREIQKMDAEEKIRLNRIMTKFIEDFQKDKEFITGGK